MTEPSEHFNSGIKPWEHFTPPAPTTTPNRLPEQPPAQLEPTAAAAAAAVPTPLDTQETSVVNSFQAWFRTNSIGCRTLSDYELSTNSASKFRHSGWWKIRERVWRSLVRTGQPSSRVFGFAGCGSGSWIAQANDDANRFQIRHNNCHDRLCTPCANARSQILRQHLMSAIQGKTVKFITLTLCGKGEKLTDLVDRLYRSFRYLRNHPVWDKNVKGGAAFLEVKWSTKSNRWHPHLHIICEAGYIRSGELSDAWRGITKDSFIVDIRQVRDEATTASYVTKYASKPLNMSFALSDELLDEAVVALKGRRLCLCFGDWYGTPLATAEDEELADDLVDAGGYHYFADLATTIDAANSGDPSAINLLTAAGISDRWRTSAPMDDST